MEHNLRSSQIYQSVGAGSKIHTKKSSQNLCSRSTCIPQLGFVEKLNSFPRVLN